MSAAGQQDSVGNADEVISPFERSKYPWIVASDALHTYRRHDTRRWKIAQVLSSGGLSLIDNRRYPCSCNQDATAMIRALLDAGFVIVPEQNDGENDA